MHRLQQIGRALNFLELHTEGDVSVQYLDNYEINNIKNKLGYIHYIERGIYELGEYYDSSFNYVTIIIRSMQEPKKYTVVFVENVDSMINAFTISSKIVNYCFPSSMNIEEELNAPEITPSLVNYILL